MIKEFSLNLCCRRSAAYPVVPGVAHDGLDAQFGDRRREVLAAVDFLLRGGALRVGGDRTPSATPIFGMCRRLGQRDKLRRPYRGNIRARSSSGPARPYIARLRDFRRLICPSVWPLLQRSEIAFLTASISLRKAREKRRIA